MRCPQCPCDMPLRECDCPNCGYIVTDFDLQQHFDELDTARFRNRGEDRPLQPEPIPE